MASDNFDCIWDSSFDSSEEMNENQSQNTNTSLTSVLHGDKDEFHEPELIRLNIEGESVKLDVGEEFKSAYEESFSLPTANSFAVSVLGDTCNGKSFVVNNLLPSGESKRPVVIEENHRLHAVTANVNCFTSRNFFQESDNGILILLDYEGEQSATLPRTLRKSDCIDPKIIDRRREAIGDYFPKLSYIISNVIILVSREEFSHYNYFQRCCEFAQRAIKNSQQNPYKPVLILIQNFSEPSKKTSLKEVTQEFQKIHDTNNMNKLRSFFEEIYCMRLPRQNKTNSTDTNRNDEHDVFTKQINELKSFLIYNYNQQKAQRTIPYPLWLDITRSVVSTISRGHTVLMHSLLRQQLVTDPGDFEKTIVTYFFNILYDKKTIHSTRWYYFCQEFAIHLLARTVALRLVNELKYLPEGNMKKMSIQEECRVCLGKLWEWLDHYRPCTAVYVGPGGVKEKNHIVFCYQHKGVHQRTHKTSEEVECVPNSSIGFFKFSRLRSVLDVWRGSFQEDNCERKSLTQQIHENFLNETLLYMERISKDKSQVFDTLDQLLKEYQIVFDIDYRHDIIKCCFCFETHERSRTTRKSFKNKFVCDECRKKLKNSTVQNLPIVKIFNTDADNECEICLAKSQRVSLDPCKHRCFCQSCATLLMEKVKLCPLCRTSINKIVP